MKKDQLNPYIMKNKYKIKWLKLPEDHDYPAALSYLSLIYDEFTAQKYIIALKRGEIVYFKAKDIFRASKLSLLGVSNSHVISNQKKIRKGESLSPLLLKRDTVTMSVIIADGYHRLCAVYHYDEDALIPCKIV